MADLKKYLKTNNGASINAAGIAELNALEAVLEETHYPINICSYHIEMLDNTNRGIPTADMRVRAYTTDPDDLPVTISDTGEIVFTAKYAMQYIMFLTVTATNTGAAKDYLYIRPSDNYDTWIDIAPGETKQAHAVGMGTLAQFATLTPRAKSYTAEQKLRLESFNLLLMVLPPQRVTMLTAR